MKKLTALALCLVMVLSLVVVASAAVDPATVGTVASDYKPEGTGIDSIDKITDLKGKYYLTADVTVTAMFEKKFEGTLDGNGKKITVSAPVFKQANNATFKNIVLAGEIKYDGKAPKAGTGYYAASLVLAVSGESTFTNILSSANISALDKESYAAGIVGSYTGKVTLTFDTCVNTGNVESGKRAGGIFGFGFQDATITFKNCVNNGNVTSPGSTGGIFDQAGSGKSVLTVENCVNNGVITSESYAGGIYAQSISETTVTGCVNNGAVNGNGHTGGIVGQHPQSKAVLYVFRNCVNNGAISTKTSGHTGGLIGYIWASNADVYGDIQGCLNTGVITGTGFVSQFIAYTNSVETIIKNNLGLGKVQGEGADLHLAFVGCSSADASGYDVENNYVTADSGYLLFSYTATADNAHNIVEFDKRKEGTIIVATADQLASGEVAFALNEALQEDVFRQTIGTDVAPTINETSKYVIQNADGKFANSDTPKEYTSATEEPTTEPESSSDATTKVTTAKPEPTKAPEATAAPETTAAAEGGCGSVIGTGAAVAVAALALTFIAFKKKED